LRLTATNYLLNESVTVTLWYGISHAVTCFQFCLANSQQNVHSSASCHWVSSWNRHS